MNSMFINIFFPVLLACSGGSSDSHLAFSSFNSISHDGEERNFGMYVPESYDGSSDVPLVVNFHGGCMDAGSHYCENVDPFGYYKGVTVAIVSNIIYFSNYCFLINF